MRNSRNFLLIVAAMAVLIAFASGQPVKKHQQQEQTEVVYYPFNDVKYDPKIRFAIPGLFPFNIIDAPLTCPPGQMIDHTGFCRDVWRSQLQFSNLLNLNIS